MVKNKTATISRRVYILKGPKDLEGTELSIDDLAEEYCVILIGEPGSGKSVSIEQLADRLNAPVVKAAMVRYANTPPSSNILLVDGLDECRIGAQPHAKSDALDRVMDFLQTNKPDRWWISCRAEDWRMATDGDRLHFVSAERPVVVAQLLPLNRSEQIEILSALGNSDPEALLARIEKSSAAGFLQSPLMLKFLNGIDTTEAIPATRFELFQKAVTAMAEELENETRQEDHTRATSAQIIAVASKIAAIALISAHSEIWRSAGPAPHEKFLKRHDVDVDTDHLKNTLDTALFSGDGARFSFVHRTISEFLAGKLLAEKVAGLGGTAKLSFRRACALMTTADGRPPTELRGVFAWFATHLAKHQFNKEIDDLIERDAASILIYGDVAQLNVEQRRNILNSLDRKDPYFRGSHYGASAIGALASEDLADEFKSILTDRDGSPHLQNTVFEALSNGQPVPTLRPFLYELALDPSRGYWVSRAAMESWLNGSKDVETDRRTLFDALSEQPNSEPAAVLRIQLAAELSQEHVSVEELRAVVRCYAECEAEAMVLGRLQPLAQKLKEAPVPELFDAPLLPTRQEWDDDGDHLREVERFIEKVLAATIKGVSNLTAKRLYSWLRNTPKPDRIYGNHDRDEAIREWIGDDARRELALLDQIVNDCSTFDERPWLANHNFVECVGRDPSPELVALLLRRHQTSTDKKTKDRSIRLAVLISRLYVIADRRFEELYQTVEQTLDPDLLKLLTTSPLHDDDLKWKHEQKSWEGRREAKRQSYIKALLPKIEELRRGTDIQGLLQTARQYIESGKPHRKATDALHGVAERTTAEIAEAAAQGWVVVARTGLDSFTPAGLAGDRRGHTTNYDPREFVASAAIDFALETNCPEKLSDAPLVLAIIAIKGALHFADQERQKRLINFAADLLISKPQGREMLLEYWSTSLGQGDPWADGLDSLAGYEPIRDLLSGVILDLLRTLPNMPHGALTSLLGRAVELCPHENLAKIASAATQKAGLEDDQLWSWRFVDLVLSPSESKVQELALDRPDDELSVFERASDWFFERFVAGSENVAPLVHFAIVASMAPRSDPNQQRQTGPVTSEMRRADEIRQSISALGANTSAEANRLLVRLIDYQPVAAWRPLLRHHRAQQAQKLRDEEFSAPQPKLVVDALRAGAPATSTDLRAVIVEEIEAYSKELSSGDIQEWRNYWDKIDSTNQSFRPKSENECRDYLLARLRDRLKAFGIHHAAPESQSAQGRRADILFSTALNKKVPIEAKRHWHPELWTAINTQLADYAADPEADGNGVYLVFWFGQGAETSSPKKRDAATPFPAIPGELRDQILETLNDEIHKKFDVVILDVSKREDDK